MDDRAEKLRAKAKEELRQGKLIDTSLYETDMKVLVEELSIYQIELEHQNQELIEAQDYLLQSNSRYLDLFDNAPVGYLIVDSTGIIKDINQTACALFESSKTQFINTKISNLIHPDYQDIYYVYFRTLSNQKLNQPCDIKLRKATNNYFYGRIQGVCQTTENNNNREFRLAISDISIQKEMEIKLLEAKTLTEQNEKLHQIVLQTAKDGYWLTDFKGKLIEVNDAYCNMSGYTQNELLNMSISDVEVVENKKETEQHIKKLIQNGSDRFESKHRRKDGSVYDVEISTIYNPEYKKAIVVFIRDITEQKRKEKIIKRSESELKSLVNSGNIYVIKTDLEGKYTFFNKKFQEKFEWIFGKGGIIGRSSMESIFLEDQTKAIQVVNKCIAQPNTAFGVELRKPLQNGKHLITFWYFTCNLNPKGEPAEIICVGIDISELRKAEKALRQSEEKFRNFFENSVVGQSITSIDGKLTVNKAFCDIVGYSEDELNNLNWMEITHQEDIELNVSILNSILKGEKESELWEKRYIHKDGHTVWTVISIALVRDDNDDPLYFITAVIDISERKKTEDALRKSQEMIISSQSIAHICSYSTNLNTNEIEKSVWECSPEFYKIFGIDETYPHTIAGWAAFIHPDFREELVAYHEHVIKSGISFSNEYKIIRINDGAERWVHGTGEIVYDKQGNPIRMYGAIQDITERKKAEEKLRESEEKLSTLFNSMTEMVVMHELVFDEKEEVIDYRILDCNKTFTTITGIEKENAVGRLATDVYGVETAPYLQEYANVVLNEQSLVLSTYYPPMDKYFLISVVPSGKNRFSTITTDITSSEKIHEIMKEKNKELENYIYVASHDLRSPLVNIQGFSQRLQKQTNELTKAVTELNANTEIVAKLNKITTDDIPKSLSFILNNVGKMDTLINGLLQVSRTGRLVMNPSLLDANKLFKDILVVFDYQLKEMQANVVVHELDDCYGDQNQLNQLFSNIIGNALKYREKSRTLTLEISSQAKFNKVIYSIKDNGIGINQRHLQRIWDVFYRVDASASEAGEGIGLSLAKRIVDKHKGKLWAESVVGSGSTFYVELHKNKFEE